MWVVLPMPVTPEVFAVTSWAPGVATPVASAPRRLSLLMVSYQKVLTAA